ncbi:MAG: hypothetical protein IJJ80_08605 [Clostridia bacterium]|nr:hypothetical protein [Clostridia bacterium]
MEEQKPVESTPQEQPEEIVPATVFSFGPEEQSQVDAGDNAEAAGEEASQDSKQVEAPEGADGVDSQVSEEQRRITQAIGREKARIRQKYEQDDAYKLGRMMIDDLMRQDETLTKADAGKKAIDNFNRAVSKRDGVALSVLQDIQDLKAQRQTEPEDDDPVEQIYQDVLNAPKPKGFNEQKAYADPEFIRLLTGCDERGNQVDEPMPAKYAIQVYMANQRASQAEYDVAEKVRAGKALPQSIKPQQRVSPRTDWTKVSDEEFLKEKERRKNYY